MAEKWRISGPFSEVGIGSPTSEKARLFYMETYLLRKCVSGCDLGLDNAN